MKMREKFNRMYEFVQRDGKGTLLEHLEEIGYFTSPASTQYHLAKEGGLLEHSVNVTDLMIKIAVPLNQEKALSNDINKFTESIVIVGLFHDLGKAGYYGKPNYVENILKSGKRSEAKPYETNKELSNIPHEVSSIHILSQFIGLTEEETFAILYHNGLYTSVGYGLRGNEQPLQMLLHFSDLWCSRYTEV